MRSCGSASWCVDRSTCPSGLLKDFDRNYSGCTEYDAYLAEWCEGGCSQCSGSVVSIYVCVEQPMSNCVPLGHGPAAQVNCGVTTVFPDCQCQATPPAGENVTPNGCCCFGVHQPSQAPCMATRCLYGMGGN